MPQLKLKIRKVGGSSQFQQPEGQVHHHRLFFLPDFGDELFVGWNHHLAAVGTGDDEEPVVGLVVDGGDGADELAAVAVRHAEADEVVEGDFVVVEFLLVFLLDEDGTVDEHLGGFEGVDVLELHDGGGVAAEAVFLNEEGDEDAVDLADDVVAVGTVPHVVGELEVNLSLQSVRLAHAAYLIYVFRSDHWILLMAAPRAVSRPSMSS